MPPASFFTADRTLFIGSYSSGVYVSRDAGKTWAPLNTGRGNLTVHGLALAATGPQSGALYAATLGSEGGGSIRAVPLRLYSPGYSEGALAPVW